MLAWHEGWPDIIRNILSNDEAVFHINRFVNHHNYHYWANEDPSIIEEKFQNQHKSMAGMTLDRIEGPLIMCDILNANGISPHCNINLASCQ